MSIEKFSDPGLPEHQHRQTDVSEKHADRAERQIAILFVLSAVGTIGTIASYIFIKPNSFVFVPVIGDTNAQQLFLGLGLAVSLLFIGLAAIHWAKQLMPDHEVVAERHEFRSEDKDRKEFVAAAKEGAAAAGLGRRSLIKRSMGLALGLIGLTPLVMLRDLGSLPKKQLNKTNWQAGTRLVLDPSNRPVKVSDLEVGSVAQILPELPEGQERTLESIATDAVLLIRIRPEEFNLDAERLSWTSQRFVHTWVAQLLSMNNRPSTYSAHVTNQHLM
jgi:ubiquinol-cytochrome c reductase iron-sulfur subunit